MVGSANLAFSTEPLPMEELACCAVCNDGEWIEGVVFLNISRNPRILSYFVMAAISVSTHLAMAIH